MTAETASKTVIMKKQLKGKLAEQVDCLAGVSIRDSFYVFTNDD